MKINLRESLNKIDLATDNKYDLLNTFNSKKLSDNSKKKLAEAIKNNSIDSINRVLHESEEKVFTVKVYQNYPFVAEVIDNSIIDKNGEGKVLKKFTDRDDLDTFANELISKGYVNYQGYSKNKSLHESEEQLYKVVISSGATKRNFESALYEDEAEEIVDYYGGRWIDENGFEWDMYVEEDDDSTEHTMIDNSYDMEDDNERAQRECVESLNEADYGGAYDIENDMFFTKEDIVEFAEEVCEYLGDIFGYQYDINNVYMDGPRKLYINIYDNNYIEVESTFDIDMRKIRKPSDLFKVYGLTIENWFQKAFAREYKDAGLDESLTENKKVKSNELTNRRGLPRDSWELVKITDGVVSYKGTYECDIYSRELDNNYRLYNYYQGEVIFDDYGINDPQLIQDVFPDVGTKVKLAIYKVPENDPDHHWTGDYFVDYIDEINESLNEDLNDLDLILNTPADTKQFNEETFKALKNLVLEYKKDLDSLDQWALESEKEPFVKKWYKLADKCKEIAKNGIRGITGYGRLNDAIKLKVVDLARSVDNTFPWYTRNNLAKFNKLESLKEAIDDEIDLDYETDFDDGKVEEGDTFIEDGTEWCWIERIAGPVHLDFDNWSVWSARNWDQVQDAWHNIDIETRREAINSRDTDFFIEVINNVYDQAEVAYFVVDEDTGFIDWGPVENQTEAQDFLNGKVEDYENDEEYEEVEVEEESLKESINQNDVFKFLDEIKDTVSSFKNRVQEVSEYFNISEDEAEDFVYDWEQEESLTESRAIKNDGDYEVILHYDDIGDGKDYDYTLGYDEVVDYLKELAWSNGDGPEDLNEDEYLEWVMDNFDELADKYELNVLDYFEDEASQHEYDHRYDEP